MKKLSKLLALLLALAMVFSVLAACSSSDETNDSDDTQQSSNSGDNSTNSGDNAGNADADKDYTLNIGVLTSSSTHDPTSEQTQRYQQRTVFECLMNQNPETGEIVPWLASSVEYTDEKTLLVKLREDVYFTDGQNMTAKDAFYSLKDVWAAGRQGSYFVCYDWDNSSIIDDYTIEFKFTEVYGPATTTLALYNVFCYEDLFGENPVDADKWMQSPNGTGPYKCVENVISSHVTYALKDDYWGEKPECTEVTYKYYSETTTMFIDFEAGNLDVACAIASTDAERVLNGECPSYTGYYLNPVKDVLMAILPEEKEIFDDVRVREAFFKAVNREDVAKAMYGPLFIAADSILPAPVKYHESQEVPDYDPEGAKALLTEAGYPDGISLRLIVTQDMSVLAEALQGSLATAGINITVESYDVPTAVGMMRELECDFICKQAEGGALINEPALLLDTLSPESTLPPAGMQDPVWAEAFYKSVYNSDDAARAAAYAELQEWAIGQYRCLPICERANMTVYNKDKLASFELVAADEPVAIFAKFN